jgi:hypothetical protein
MKKSLGTVLSELDQTLLWQHCGGHAARLGPEAARSHFDLLRSRKLGASMPVEPCRSKPLLTTQASGSVGSSSLTCRKLSRPV